MNFLAYFHFSLIFSKELPRAIAFVGWVKERNPTNTYVWLK
ncbi:MULTISPECIES: hypothetical protein [Crocosphaera]|uniref:Uncharacterized protein n=3 Tax=Crocosphaera watsonii TaxID=263511 RepID=G5J0T0_CROWT|nr:MULTISPECIES: hypothetical protein [Crocosphaera]EHJ14205.1 hypothetical protein CWATWH0003_1118 [Crocosphaera watsonii WH 0003]CCQ58133.1 hypothetical protein CWATWH0005_1380 [Crocosphaera watsonii WH 0005]CCQ61700.1 hypothetical protein CWATWH0401_522 [Crocosphaera watsonii WH 0401]